MNRLYNLDYLRGMAAFGIMIFHYLSWTLGEFSADSFLGRLGIYGVSIFYILSGLTLYYVYYDKMIPSREDIYSFFRKRIFRIFPLLWLVTLIAILMSWQIPDFFDLFLNLSGLFGFVKWATYFSTGIWSIGNELVFYAFFPFFVLLTKKYPSLMIILSVFIFSLYLYFAFIRLNTSTTLTEQWENYLNPLNQVFLFLGGFLIGLFFHNRDMKDAFNIIILLIGLALFIFYPVNGSVIHLVTGVNRMVFTLSCFLICLSFYKLSFKLPVIIHRPLTLLGEGSYSVYLLHPIVYSLAGFIMVICNKYIFHFPETVRVLLAIILTVLISFIVYRYFEKYFMKLGKRGKDTLSGQQKKERVLDIS